MRNTCVRLNLCEIKFEPLVQEILFKDCFSIFSSISHFVQQSRTNIIILVECIMGKI